MGGGMGAGGSTWQDLEGQRRKDLDIRIKIHRYETGERGSLHPVFCGIINDWMDFTNSIGTLVSLYLFSHFPVCHMII